MGRKKKQEEVEEGAPAWMLTYGDMVTLILTFFVLLISMMVIDPKKFVEVLGVFEDATGEGSNIPTDKDVVPTKNYFIQVIRASTKRSRVQQGGELEMVTGEAPMVFAFKENYVVKFADEHFFREFNVVLTPAAKERLAELAQLILKEGSNRINLIGHYSQVEANMATFGELSEHLGDQLSGLTRQFEFFSRSQPNQLDPRLIVINEPRDLAYWRARAVEEYLVFQGIPRVRMKIEAGRMISDMVERANVPQYKISKKLPSGSVYSVPGKKTTTVHKGSAETARPDMVVDGMILRPWSRFIFVEGGGDRGRTVEIVVTGETIGVDAFSPPASR